MSERSFWSVLKVLLAASSLLVASLLTLIVVGALAVFLFHRSAPKTVEIVRYASVPNSSLAPAPVCSTRTAAH